MMFRNKVAFGFVMLGLVGGTWIVRASIEAETEFQASLTPERRAQIDNLAKEMRTLQKGDLIEYLNGGVLMVIMDVLQRDQPTVYVKGWHWSEAETCSIESEARDVSVIYRMDDPEYLKVLKRHMGRSVDPSLYSLER